MQTVQTKIKLLLQEQSDDLGLHCLSKRVLKKSADNRTGLVTFVVIGASRVFILRICVILCKPLFPFHID